MRRKALTVAIVAVAGWAAVHYGYEALTGECPCTLRRRGQFALALLLLRGLEAEGYLDLDESSEE